MHRASNKITYILIFSVTSNDLEFINKIILHICGYNVYSCGYNVNSCGYNEYSCGYNVYSCGYNEYLKMSSVSVAMLVLCCNWLEMLHEFHMFSDATVCIIIR